MRLSRWQNASTLLLVLINFPGLAFCIFASASIIRAGVSEFPDDWTFQMFWFVFTAAMIGISSSAFYAWKADRLNVARTMLLSQFAAFLAGFSGFLYAASFR